MAYAGASKVLQNPNVPISVDRKEPAGACQRATAHRLFAGAVGTHLKGGVSAALCNSNEEVSVCCVDMHADEEHGLLAVLVEAVRALATLCCAERKPMEEAGFRRWSLLLLH